MSKRRNHDPAFKAPVALEVSKAHAVGWKVGRGLIERAPPNLSVGKQYGILSLSRSSFYYQAKGETDLNLDLMRRINE